MKLAVIFNGQGAQYEGMGQDFAQAFPQAQSIYEEAEAVTAYPVRQWINEDFEALSQTRHAQLAIAATSLAIYESISQLLPAIDYMAGLSLGEYSALIASGMLDLAEGFDLLKQRGNLMSDHCEWLRQTRSIEMQAILKMPLDEVQAVIDQVNQENPDQQVYVANINSSSQIVIAGTSPAIDRFKAVAKEAGYKRTIPLQVEGPFHSPYMEPVCQPYAQALESVAFRETDIPVISNTSLEAHQIDTIKPTLVHHLVEPVRWQQTIDYFSDQDVSHIIQIGPGATLANLLKREPNAPACLVLDKLEDIDQIEDFLGGAK